MEFNVENNYLRYISFIEKFIKREGVEDLIKFLENSDIKTAPASTKYHLSCEGGLVQHSINVFNRLIKIMRSEYGEEDWPYSKETLAIVALLHDISKVNFYQVSFRNVKNEQGQWESVPYYSVREDSSKLFMGGHEENSVYIIEEFIKLTYEEKLAIRYHMNALDTDDKSERGRAFTAHKKSRLALYLYLADMLACCVDESTDSITSFNPIENYHVKEKENGCIIEPAPDDAPF